MKEISVLGIDLAKSVFQLHGVDENGNAVLRRRVSRKELANVVANLRPCLIGMEACGSSNYWARTFQSFGHQVKLMPAQYVKPYVKTNKNDAQDAEACCEAVTRPSMRFVSIKSVAQQDIQSLHRIRRRLIRNRTALMNEVRGLLLEYGIVIPQNVSQLKKAFALHLDDTATALTELMKESLRQLQQELRFIEEQIALYNDKLERLFKTNEVCQRIGEIEGVGPITATAVYAAVNDPHAFKNGRHFAAYLGLVPRQRSSGGKDRLLRISKRGDKYLRSLLVHGARSVLRVAPQKTDRRSVWASEKLKSRGHNKACVAIANKNARIIWALMAKGEAYRRAA